MCWVLGSAAVFTGAALIFSGAGHWAVANAHHRVIMDVDPGRPWDPDFYKQMVHHDRMGLGLTLGGAALAAGGLAAFLVKRWLDRRIAHEQAAAPPPPGDGEAASMQEATSMQEGASLQEASSLQDGASLQEGSSLQEGASFRRSRREHPAPPGSLHSAPSPTRLEILPVAGPYQGLVIQGRF